MVFVNFDTVNTFHFSFSNHSSASEYIFLFFNQIGHYWMPKRLCCKNSYQLPVLNWLTDIFAEGKFDYDAMVRYQNLTRKPELFRAP